MPEVFPCTHCTSVAVLADILQHSTPETWTSQVHLFIFILPNYQSNVDLNSAIVGTFHSVSPCCLVVGGGHQHLPNCVCGKLLISALEQCKCDTESGHKMEGDAVIGSVYACD